MNLLKKKRQGTANPQVKELNKLIWEYVSLREDMIHHVATHKDNKIMAQYAEDIITYCEHVLGIGTAQGSIEEKLHNTETAVNKLKNAKQFMEVYS